MEAKHKQLDRDPAYRPDEFADDGVARPGVLLDLRGHDRDQAKYKLGTLWVWTRNGEQHYLMQTSHRKNCHRVQAVFWTSVVANAVRQLIEDAMRSGNIGVYVMLRESGIAPLTQYRQTIEGPVYDVRVALKQAAPKKVPKKAKRKR